MATPAPFAELDELLSGRKMYADVKAAFQGNTRVEQNIFPPLEVVFYASSNPMLGGDDEGTVLIELTQEMTPIDSSKSRVVLAALFLTKLAEYAQSEKQKVPQWVHEELRKMGLDTPPGYNPLAVRASFGGHYPQLERGEETGIIRTRLYTPGGEQEFKGRLYFQDLDYYQWQGWRIRGSGVLGALPCFRLPEVLPFLDEYPLPPWSEERGIRSLLSPEVFHPEVRYKFFAMTVPPLDIYEPAELALWRTIMCSPPVSIRSDKDPLPDLKERFRQKLSIEDGDVGAEDKRLWRIYSILRILEAIRGIDVALIPQREAYGLARLLLWSYEEIPNDTPPLLRRVILERMISWVQLYLLASFFGYHPRELGDKVLKVMPQGYVERIINAYDDIHKEKPFDERAEGFYIDWPREVKGSEKVRKVNELLAKPESLRRLLFLFLMGGYEPVRISDVLLCKRCMYSEPQIPWSRSVIPSARLLVALYNGLFTEGPSPLF